jgi:RNA polymerase sigma-70 factor (ECF subfamily)
MGLSVDRKDDRKEKALIRSSIDGDSEAFEALYLRYLESIYRYIYFRLGDEAQAEDMTEEVFVRAWEALPNFKPGKSPFVSWLYRIAHNLLVDYYRRRNPISIPVEDLAHHSDPRELPELMVGKKLDFEMLAKAIIQLDPLEQEVIILRFVQGFSHREVAAVIKKSATASRVIQHRALNALRDLLEKWGFINVE